MKSLLQAWLAEPLDIERIPAKDAMGCQALFLRGIPYQNQQTYAFAYIAEPPGNAPTPGVLLLHGGGGTAYPQWAAKWAAHGYTALALDLEGHIPVAPGSYARARNPRTGVQMHNDFEDSNLPVEDQWMTHSIAAAARGYNYLSLLPRVKGMPIGVTGISWGSITASLLIGLDTRFAFSVLIYGAAHLPDDPAHFGNVFRANPRARTLWDATENLPRIHTPTLLINGLNDLFFSPLSTMRTKADLPDACAALIPDFEHSHEAAFERLEPIAFADSVVAGRKRPKVEIIRCKQGLRIRIEADEDNLFWQYASAGGGLVYPRDMACNTIWEISPRIPVSTHDFLLPEPPSKCIFFVNLLDDHSLVTSSNLITP